MTIQEVLIENYLCYYGVKKFAFSEGLNIILGENGEGKTKFFEAIEWLLKGDTNQLELMVSAKKVHEIVPGESFRVRVAITANQHNETKILTRQFTIKKKENGTIETSKPSLEGVEELKNGERSQVDGQRLMDQLFPSAISRYSMFKGEATLNIFENDDALLNLINTFSDAKHFDKYLDKGKFLQLEAEKAVDAASRSETKNKALYNRLEFEINQLEESKSRIKTFLDSTSEQIKKTRENLEEVENYVQNAEALETINKRISDLRTKIDQKGACIHEDFTIELFDEKWLLMDFETIHNEFAQKVNSFSSQHRTLQSEFDKEVGIKIGEKRAQAKLLNDAIPLPITVPSKAIMEEMLKDELCKVCNRKAEKDSEPYKFMLKRLEEYINHQMPSNQEDDMPEKLFSYDYITKLVNMSATHEDSLSSIRDIRTAIKELFELNDKIRSEIEKLNASLEVETEERNRIIGNSTIGESRLQDVLKNYNGWQKDLAKYQKEEIDYESQLNGIKLTLQQKKQEKDKIDIEVANTFLIKTRTILRDICTIFKDTRDLKFDEFILELQKKSNEFFSKINAGAFHGEIRIIKKSKSTKTVVDVELHENDQILYKPNQSLLTSMHIAVLFAISELASNRNEERYPLIFDAPTSSFGETKTGAFLNIISETGNQIILLLKDFIINDLEKGLLTIKPEFNQIKRDKAFWVKLERPFNQKVLSTINTEIISL